MAEDLSGDRYSPDLTSEQVTFLCEDPSQKKGRAAEQNSSAQLDPESLGGIVSGSNIIRTFLSLCLFLLLHV